jgi:hypothetical protein
MGDLLVKEIAAFQPVGATDSTEKRVRIVQFGERTKDGGEKFAAPVFDLRPFVTGRKFTGWGKGVCLSLAELDALLAQAPAIRAQLAAETASYAPAAKAA